MRDLWNSSSGSGSFASLLLFEVFVAVIGRTTGAFAFGCFEPGDGLGDIFLVYIYDFAADVMVSSLSNVLFLKLLVRSSRTSNLDRPPENLS